MLFRKNDKADEETRQPQTQPPPLAKSVAEVGSTTSPNVDFSGRLNHNESAIEGTGGWPMQTEKA